MQYILLILCLIQLAAIVWLVMQVQKLRRPQDDTALRTLRQEIAADTQNQMQMLGNLLSENQRQSGDYQAERLEQMERGMDGCGSSKAVWETWSVPMPRAWSRYALPLPQIFTGCRPSSRTAWRRYNPRSTKSWRSR